MTTNKIFKKKARPNYNKKYVAKTKTKTVCVNCKEEFLTSRLNQTFCNEVGCQVARKKLNMDDFVRRQIKKINERTGGQP